MLQTISRLITSPKMQVVLLGNDFKAIHNFMYHVHFQGLNCTKIHVWCSNRLVKARSLLSAICISNDYLTNQRFVLRLRAVFCVALLHCACCVCCDIIPDNRLALYLHVAFTEWHKNAAQRKAVHHIVS